jgi:CRP-like cAMP-binding protein
MHFQPATSIDRTAERLCRRMTGIRPLHDAILADLRQLARERIDLPAGRALAKEGDQGAALYAVETGWILRARTLACGRRQIIDYVLPGDLLGADAVLFGVSGFDLAARSNARLVRLETPAAADLWRRHPGLSSAIAWTVAHEQSVLAERIVSLGRRDSLEKLSFALCEMAARLGAIGALNGDVIETPVNQEDFADILGISVIHVNRTFRKLSDDGVVEYAKSRIRILDKPRLAAIAGFTPGYLHQSPDSGS